MASVADQEVVVSTAEEELVGTLVVVLGAVEEEREAVEALGNLWFPRASGEEERECRTDRLEEAGEEGVLVAMSLEGEDGRMIKFDGISTCLPLPEEHYSLWQV
jgi:hypothetical protein